MPATARTASETLGTNEPLSAPPDWHDPPPADDEDVARALRNIKAMPLTKGPGVSEGKTLGDNWLAWEDTLTRHLFGKKRPDGTRQIETVYVEIAKKSGKSHYAAGLGLHMLGGQDEWGAEVYSAGYNQNQAKVTWGIAGDMIELQPALQGRFEVKAYRNEILCEALRGVWKPLSRQDLGQHGFNPYAVIFDELHTQQSRAMWDAIKRSMGARVQPLLFAITNAGYDRQSICFQMRDYAMRVNRGEVDDPSFLGVIFGADPDTDDWTDPETWKRANPGLGHTTMTRRVRQECDEAKAQPSAQNSFKRWHLSIWTQQDTKWLDPEDWKACEGDFTEAELTDAECYGGLDLGSVSDLTAWVKAFPDPDDPETIRVTCDAWCPRQRLHDRQNPYRDAYQAWARDGWLEVVDTLGGRVMDYGAVKRKIVEDSDVYALGDLAVDKAFQGNQLLVELIEDHGLEAAGMRTTYNDMTSPCDELERRIQTTPPKILHDGNPVLAWAVSNVALRQPDDDRKRPVKDTDDAKIDPVVALLMALDRAMRHEGRSEPSVYEERGVVVL